MPSPVDFCRRRWILPSPVDFCRRRWILPSAVDFCRRRWILPSAAAARTAEHLRRRWVLPSLLLPEQLNHLRHGGFCCRCGGDGSQPLPPTGDSRKKKAVGKFVPASARPSPCFRWICPHLWHFDPLTVISLSPRKSLGAAGALSLSPDGVSDPAEGADPAPASEVRTKDGESEAGRGSSEKGGGSGQLST